MTSNLLVLTKVFSVLLNVLLMSGGICQTLGVSRRRVEHLPIRPKSERKNKTCHICIAQDLKKPLTSSIYIFAYNNLLYAVKSSSTEHGINILHCRRALLTGTCSHVGTHCAQKKPIHMNSNNCLILMLGSDESDFVCGV